MAVVIGYIAQRKRFFGNRAMEFFSMLNYALPDVVGIAYVIAFNERADSAHRTMTILVAAYMFRYHAAGICAVITAPPDRSSIEEASSSLGAARSAPSSATVPLMIPAVLWECATFHPLDDGDQRDDLPRLRRWSPLTTRILECMTELQSSQACAFRCSSCLFLPPPPY